jgi:hypothetical protein
VPELVTIQTDKYDFIIWSKDISDSRNRLIKTLGSRGKAVSNSRILVAPAIFEKGSNESKIEFDIGTPVFFENKLYDIEFAFDSSLRNSLSENSPKIEHRLRVIEDAFHYSPRTNSLRATLNTGNDIGWFRFELVYQLEGKVFRQSFSFEVLPVKIDMLTDLQVMNDSIDREFPLWRFSLAEKTQQNMKAVKKPHPDFLLLWLAQFESLLHELNCGLKHIVNAPHSRLLPIRRSVKMDRLKGKLSVKLEQEVTQMKSSNNYEKPFKLNKKILSVDTPENRFIKSVVVTAASKLAKVNKASRRSQIKPEKQRLSSSFFNKIERWQSDMRFFQRQPLFREVGKFTGLQRESLVLQQKSGYAKVYKTWQQLKWYLDLLEGDSDLSLRSVSELYEIWCFLEVRRILLQLDFKEVENSRIPMINSGVEVSFKDGMQGTFRLVRDDGIKLRLAHEPKFQRNGAEIRSWTTMQKPDIFLEATFPDDEKIVWLFDAKYRIKKPDEFNSEKDYVPDDAINQMHRYRDALIHIEKSIDKEKTRKARPVFGAYALYPGFYNQSEEVNPYSAEIEEVGIGAFSLLPSNDNSGSIWLANFLSDRLLRKNVAYENASSDKHFVGEAPRIPYLGTEVTRFNDLVITANQLGPNRSKSYVDRFRKGDANYYHTKQIAFERQRIEFHVIQEARYLAVAIDGQKGQREIKYIYPILTATKVAREQIDSEITGTKNIANPKELYWLFKLGASLQLKQTLIIPADMGFQIKLTSCEELSKALGWSDLTEKYSSIYSNL